ncbi:MAG TPA: hypothetical protein VGS57_06670, partial [Thermoanaerobaculia bacterium]|nr:hypothetical protein [Thermoanaerobaculia bacterium]
MSASGGGDEERWRRVDAILEEVLELRADERDAFLDRTCAADAQLRRELDSLLAHDRADDDFLATPAANEAVRLLARADAPLV